MGEPQIKLAPEFKPQADERTAADMAFASSLKILLGGREYEIRPLPMKRLIKWRKKIAALTEKVLPAMNLQTDDLVEFGAAVHFVLHDYPAEILDLIRSYDPDQFGVKWGLHGRVDPLGDVSVEDAIGAFIEMFTLTYRPFFTSLEVIVRTLAPKMRSTTHPAS